ncbi:thiamine pyrophosphate-dependent enzyme [Streptomyces sp. AK02-04a]|uniref:thiamine pyrophosphate-dependent enzyme n=1 Tax=Streptomyces sp. AK02-04a TaxID=3028649 RepID=UPI0029A83B7C|nr:thiamine pyrophosphate-dependent enzyme [Streptomyces sp. AK02-04a]MDX3763564.1 thiamine pyrophosphate-dependent enzyme [Streptomyces sp. AK02-04a]
MTSCTFAPCQRCLAAEIKADCLPPHATSYPHTDYAAIATAARARGIRVEKPAQVRDAPRAAFAHEGPALVNVVANRAALAMPPKISAEQISGFALWRVGRSHPVGQAVPALRTVAASRRGRRPRGSGWSRR